MNSIQLPQSDVASLLSPKAGIGTVFGPEQVQLLDWGFRPLPTPSREAIRHSPVIRPTTAHPLARRLPASVGSFLAKALRSRWESYRAELRRCQDDFSEQTVHKLRVATRRLIAQFDIAGCVTPGTTAEKARWCLKGRLKALGELRDTHVQRLFIERRMERFPELILVRDFLQRRERGLERAAAAKVKGFKTRKLEEWTLGLELHLTRKPAQARRPDRLATIVARATTKAFLAVVSRREAMDPANPSTIHRTRVAFKKFRYMLESLSPDFTGLSKRELRRLANYQRRMGILQDLEVMQQCVTAFVHEREGINALLAPFTRYLRASRARALRSFLKSADELFGFWPPGTLGTNVDIAAARRQIRADRKLGGSTVFR